MSINTASVKSDTSMHDAPPFLHQATHRSIAEKHPDITIPDAPPLPNQPEQQYTGMASITMRKFLASPVHYSYQPTVQEFAPASKDYLSQDGFPHAPRVFPQQNNVNSVLLKEESLLKGSFTQIPPRMHQPNPLQRIQYILDHWPTSKLWSIDSNIAQPQARHQQRYDVGTIEERFRRSTEALYQHAPTQNISGASGPLLNPSTPSNNGHDARPSPRRPSKQPKQPSHDDDRGRAPPSPPSPSPSSSGSDFDHSDRLRRPAFSPIRDKESKRPLNDAEKGYPDKQKYGGGRYDLLEPKLNFFINSVPCERKGLPQEYWAKAFPLMLIGDAQDHHVDQIAKYK
ncbi:hypothetical protein E4U37_006534 [Claviceps purpurea]|nr:hypothetical protein E4U37_006534 [Claviceps purpurea]